ncbi:MAG: phosphoenolpyruvate carboxylase, partial [Pseudomonadota bacterium]|nr:phosphoenolpyruvate carboxylase [Pseudomonadota bacterium]
MHSFSAAAKLASSRHSPESQLEIAHRLKRIALESIKHSQDLGGPEVARALETLIDMAWRPSNARTAGLNSDAFEAAITSLKAGQREKLIEGYARLGHLYEIAGLAAREQYFQKLRENGQPLPGGPEVLVQQMPSDWTVSRAIEAIGKPVFEMILTQHPTNTNALQSIRRQREIGIALERGAEKDLQKTVAAFMREPLLHQLNGKDRNFTVRDETLFVLNALGNIYDDLPRAYQEFDHALQAKAGGSETYNPLDLKLNIRLGSWGSSGDKDGNANVSGETTLEAIILHKKSILEKYAQSLESILPSLPEAHQAALAAKKEVFKQGADALDTLLPSFEEARKAREGTPLEGKTLMAPEQFEAIATAVKNIDAPLAAHKEDFGKTLISAYNATKNIELLNLIRQHRLFGFNFGKIEYRETSEEYSDVVSLLVDGYGKKPAEQKRVTLEEMLEHPETIQALVRDKKALIDAGAEKAYGKNPTDKDPTPKDFTPIAYHSLKRMELARDFPDMVQDNVLAECKSDINLLEAKFVQMMAAKGEKKPLLGIIPLFEEPETMQSIDTIMKAAYDSKAYEQHLHEVAADTSRNQPQLTQQVQIAHSDNARRAGALAARGFIHQAHKVLRQLHKKMAGEGRDKQLQFFEGGSVSDAYRNGVRAISGTVDDFQIYEFAKFTFQGGDLLNYLNHPASIGRLLSRSIAHPAKRLIQKSGTALKSGGNSKENDKFPVSNEIADRVAINALVETLKQYESQDFGDPDNPMGAVLAAME